MSDKKTYSLLKGIVHSFKFIVVFLVAGLSLGLKPEIKELTIGGCLILIINFIKIKWNIKLPRIE